MNCLILVALLLCCGGNSRGNNSWLGGCFGNGRSGNNNSCGNRNDGCGRREGGGRRERTDNDDCGCRSDFRQESRFEQRPFLFNQGADCGCEESQNNGCDCDRS